MYSDPNETFQRDEQNPVGSEVRNSEYAEYAHPDYYKAEEPTPEYGQSESSSAFQRDRYYSEHTWQEESNRGKESAFSSVQYTQPYQPPLADQQLNGQTAEEQQTAHESQQPGGIRKKLAGIGSGIVALGVWLLQFKSLVLFLKFGVAGFSAIVSIFLYSLIFGWPFAIGLVAILFLHEMGHALVMRLKGIRLGGLIFVPMLGAAVTMRQMPQSAKDEAEIGIAGPLAGAVVASICLWLAYQHAGSLWGPLAYFGFFINLFNLIPVVPFDGGRVLAAIDRRAWIIGFVALLSYQIWEWIHGNFNSFLLIFVIIAATQLWVRAKPNDMNGKAYYDVPLSTRISLTVAYFGLAGILFLGMTLSQHIMPGLQ